jgi:hypothetical protein
MIVSSIEKLALWVSIPALLVSVIAVIVAIYESRASRKRRMAEGTANVIVENHEVFPNPSSPAGRQISVYLRNGGPGAAYKPTVWCCDATGFERTPHRYKGDTAIAVGANQRIGMDLPASAEFDRLHVWYG